jgi:hypothetical protein
METIYANKNYHEKDQAALMRKMEYVHSQCTELNISCSEDDGKWGIWLMVGEEKMLVDPISLVNSLYADSGSYIFFSYKGENYNDCQVDVRRNSFCIDWTIDNPDFPLKGRTMYQFDEYIGKIRHTIAQIYHLMREGREVHYSCLDFELEAAEICMRQLDIKATLPSDYRLMASDVIEEEFRFTPLDSEKYSISIGDRGFTTFLTHWSSNLEEVRHQLELCSYQEEALIKLNFDCSDTILTIKHCRILDDIDADESGYGFTYKDFAKVTIEPNGCTLMPIISGYCNWKETVRTMYEGLLKMALLHGEQEQEYNNDHFPSRIEAYNMYKSPLIENLLRGQTRDDTHACMRQVRIKGIITLCPDYDYCLENERQCPVDMEDLRDKQGLPIAMPELEEWQREICELIVDVNVGEEVAFDWEDYHKRGIELAKRLRERLSTEYDLWYEAPAEDQSGTIKERMLIL